MYLFLIPLLLGFLFNSASAFTTYISRRWGEQRGKVVCMILRNVLGIPLWAFGYILAVRVPSRLFFNPVFISSTLGWLLILAGGIVIFLGLLSLRWRAVAPTVRDALAEHGLYRHIRHPLYSGMILEIAGIFLILPTLAVLVACAIGVVWVLIQARLEEIDLLQRLPAYKDYMQRVPRFIPRLHLR